MACSDADGNFNMIETGLAGKNSDGGIFKHQEWVIGFKEML